MDLQPLSGGTHLSGVDPLPFVFSDKKDYHRNGIPLVGFLLCRELLGAPSAGRGLGH